MTIDFGTGPNGRPIPLQRIRSAYWKTADGSAKKIAIGETDGAGFYVSHWETCPGASAVKARQREAT